MFSPRNTCSPWALCSPSNHILYLTPSFPRVHLLTCHPKDTSSLDPILSLAPYFPQGSIFSLTHFLVIPIFSLRMHFLPNPIFSSSPTFPKAHLLFGHYPYLGTQFLPMPHLFPNGITLMPNNIRHILKSIII